MTLLKIFVEGGLIDTHHNPCRIPAVGELVFLDVENQNKDEWGEKPETKGQFRVFSIVQGFNTVYPKQALVGVERTEIIQLFLVKKDSSLLGK